MLDLNIEWCNGWGEWRGEKLNRGIMVLLYSKVLQNAKRERTRSVQRIFDEMSAYLHS